jgi:hypothetical protein
MVKGSKLLLPLLGEPVPQSGRQGWVKRRQQTKGDGQKVLFTKRELQKFDIGQISPLCLSL